MNRLYHWCKSAIRSPLFWLAVAYGSCIPLFGFIYSHCFSDSFYAPYAKYEKSAQDDLRNAESVLDMALHRTMERSNKHLDISDWNFVGFKVTNVKLRDGGGIRFNILFRWVAKQASSSSMQRPVRAYIPGNDQRHIANSQGGFDFHRVMYIEPDEEWARRDEFYSAAYSYLTIPTSIDKGRTFSVNEEDNKQLDELFAGIGGDPVKISRGFWRMTYFSATAITTTGFGDIIPLTPMARLMAAFEAVLGIVIAGLFINAATGRRDNRPNQS